MKWQDNFDSQQPTITLVDDLTILKQKTNQLAQSDDVKDQAEAAQVKAALPTIEKLLEDGAFNLAIAAGRSCYSGNPVLPEQIPEKPKLANSVASSTWDARHHTLYMHRHFTFLLDGISRQSIWSTFHSHPFYNSEQVSQRYKKMSKENVTIPHLENEAAEVFSKAIDEQFKLYDEFRGELLFPTAAEAFFGRFPAKRKQAEKFKLDILKKTQEVARYFLPVATQAHMYHTINGITLARYHRLAQQPDVPQEVSFIVQGMIDEVTQRHPKLTALFDEPINQEELLENKVAQDYPIVSDEVETRKWIAEFDARLGENRLSRLVDYKPNGAKEMATAVRNILGVSSDALSNEEALKIVLDPAYNQQKGDVLTLDHLAKLTKAQYTPNFTFLVRLSHTADSQAQRQRMSPANRPIFENVVTSTPDFITPVLVKAVGLEAVERYEEGMTKIWGYRNRLIELGVPEEKANYVLPNGVAIRYQETVDMLNFRQKDEKRECLNAQEEIARITLEQRTDVETVHPELKGAFGPPCYLRHQASITPFCPEGSRYCGVPVWKGLQKDEDNKLTHPNFTIESAMAKRVI